MAAEKLRRRHRSLSSRFECVDGQRAGAAFHNQFVLRNVDDGSGLRLVLTGKSPRNREQVIYLERVDKILDAF